MSHVSKRNGFTHLNLSKKNFGGVPLQKLSKRNLGGFTLIELMLAMSFVAFLLIAISMTVIQIGNIYNRGLTLKDVNQAGRSITSELQRSINQSSPFSVSGTDSKLITQDWGGRLCTGQYSYIWNYGKDITTNNHARLNIYTGDPSDKWIRFVKIVDPAANYCRSSATPPEVAYPTVTAADAVELLNVGQHNLAIHSFDITSSSSASDAKTGQRLYNIQFVIGTNDQNALMLIDNLSCKPPSEANSDINYCSINEFNITVRAGNKAQ